MLETKMKNRFRKRVKIEQRVEINWTVDIRRRDGVNIGKRAARKNPETTWKRLLYLYKRIFL